MIKIGAGRLAALSVAAAAYDVDDYEEAVKNPRLVKIKENKELIGSILENALLDSEVQATWITIGREMAMLYERGEMYDPDMHDALTDLVYLAMPPEVKKAYRGKKQAPTKKGQTDSPLVAKLKKARRDARNRVSNTVNKIINAAYPKRTAKESPSEKKDKEADAEKELAKIKKAAKRGSPYVEEAKEGKAGKDDEDDEDGEDDEEDDGRSNVSGSSKMGVDETLAQTLGLGVAAGAGSAKPVVFTVNEVYAEKVSLIRAEAEEGAKVFVAHAELPASWNAERTLIVLPKEMAAKTHALFTTITATFNPDGSLTEAAKTAKQGSLTRI